MGGSLEESLSVGLGKVGDEKLDATQVKPPVGEQVEKHRICWGPGYVFKAREKVVKSKMHFSHFF